MITVNFYGDLQQFGTRYKLHVASPAEAMRALMLQIKGLREHIEQGSYQVRFKGRDLTADEVAQHFQDAASGVLHIVPRVAGAGRFGQIVFGAILIVAALWTAGWSLAGMGMLGSAAFNMGVALVLGGIAQMLAKPPSMGGLGDATQDKTSTSFSNLANTQAQGVPVPLVYGKVMCGTRIVSQGVESYRIFDKVQTGATQMRSVFDTQIQKMFHEPVAAVDPFGVAYNIDSNDDSVRAMNYSAHLVTVE